VHSDTLAVEHFSDNSHFDKTIRTPATDNCAPVIISKHHIANIFVLAYPSRLMEISIVP